MKRFSLICCMMFPAIFSLAQDSVRVNINALALCDSSIRIFYAGISNPFSVRIPGLSADSMVVTATYGELEGGNGMYSLTPAVDSSERIKTSMLFIAKVDTAGDTVTIDSAEFAVRLIPKPQAMIAGRFGGKIKKETLLAGDSIAVIFKNCYLKEKYRVTSFVMSYYKEIFYYEFDQPLGGKLTDIQKGIISRFPVGAIFYFDNIRYKGPAGVTRVLPTMKFEIVL